MTIDRFAEGGPGSVPGCGSSKYRDAEAATERRRRFPGRESRLCELKGFHRHRRLPHRCSRKIPTARPGTPTSPCSSSRRAPRSSDANDQGRDKHIADVTDCVGAIGVDQQLISNQSWNPKTTSRMPTRLGCRALRFCRTGSVSVLLTPAAVNDAPDAEGGGRVADVGPGHEPEERHNEGIDEGQERCRGAELLDQVEP